MERVGVPGDDAQEGCVMDDPEAWADVIGESQGQQEGDERSLDCDGRDGVVGDDGEHEGVLFVGAELQAVEGEGDVDQVQERSQADGEEEIEARVHRWPWHHLYLVPEPHGQGS